jgi:hypothetical protein
VPEVLNRRVNAARDARSVALARVAKQLALLLRRLGYSNLLGRLKHSRLVDRLIYRPAAPRKETVDYYPEHLVRLYHSELDGLSRLMQTDYSKWRTRSNRRVG